MRGGTEFALATGSAVMSRSKVRVEMEPTPLAVSMSALVNLMHFVVKDQRISLRSDSS